VETIKIGLLTDRSGEYALLGVQKHAAAMLAVKEINDAGGVLGKQIEVIDPDAQSTTTRYQELARQLVFEDKVAAVFGAAASMDREAIRPIFEENKMVYFYNNQYEGGVASKYTFCTGLVSEQQVVPMMQYMIKTYGPKYYIIAADYNAGTELANWVEYVGVEENGAECVGEEFVPTGVSEFSASIDKIKAANADFLVIGLVGASQSSFFAQYSTSGLNLPMCSTFVGLQYYEHKRFDPPALANLNLTCNYTEEMASVSEDAARFVKDVRTIDSSLEYVGMEAANEYIGIHMWAKAVEQAGTVESDAVVAALESGITLENMPSGTVTLDGATHHCIQDVWSAHIDENHDMIFDQKFEQVRPYWLSDVMGVDLRKENANKQFVIADMLAMRENG
jgi:branched-chain amino acid transport system substrate-binding protein